MTSPKNKPWILEKVPTIDLLVFLEGHLKRLRRQTRDKNLTNTSNIQNKIDSRLFQIKGIKQEKLHQLVLKFRHFEFLFFVRYRGL